jgi:hypothetical protein
MRYSRILDQAQISSQLPTSSGATANFLVALTGSLNKLVNATKK